MYEKIAEILSKQLLIERSKITEDSAIMENLGADSLDIVEISMEIEQQFNISIPDEEIVNFKTPRDIVSFLEKLDK
ncbi:MAG: acyl carrier protein [Clostridia bacterium]|jgi:acyl carrier protein|nr:acyl carrier protein [Clostridia bacterium]